LIQTALHTLMIYSSNPQMKGIHVWDVCAMIERLLRVNLYCNLVKCDFFTHKVEFLGFPVREKGVRMDPKRVESIAK